MNGFSVNSSMIDSLILLSNLDKIIDGEGAIIDAQTSINKTLSFAVQSATATMTDPTIMKGKKDLATLELAAKKAKLENDLREAWLQEQRFRNPTFIWNETEYQKYRSSL